tara:strand:+ start:4557 stop:4994 length:438 start_codon:yes stop_codon:yes gene_type:complete
MKKRTLNEYRQTKEYQGSSEGWKYLNDLENSFGRTVVEQNKDVEFDDLENTKEEKLKKLEKAHKIPEEIKEINLNEQMQEIAEIVVPTINDMIFNEIIEVMDDYPDLNWGYFVQDDAPTALLDACYDHKQEIHYKIFQLVLQKLK